MSRVYDFYKILMHGFLLCLLSLFSVVAGSQELKKIRYPQVFVKSIYQNQLNYFSEVLTLALDKSGLAYDLEFVDIPDLAQTRSQWLIQQGYYDIHWLVTNTERETELMPIRIPLYKGLLGLRISFVNSAKKTILGNVAGLDELKMLLVGQGRDWMDTKLLNFHQFKLMEASTTLALFEMLNINRIDYFPRSILEIDYESQQTVASGLSVDQNIALYYPEAVYFFVRKENVALHDHVSKGLNIAIDDGSFQQIFERYFGETIAQAQLDKRRIFQLSNPFLPPKTPLDDKRLWHPLTFE